MVKRVFLWEGRLRLRGVLAMDDSMAVLSAYCAVYDAMTACIDTELGGSSRAQVAAGKVSVCLLHGSDVRGLNGCSLLRRSSNWCTNAAICVGILATTWTA